MVASLSGRTLTTYWSIVVGIIIALAVSLIIELPLLLPAIVGIVLGAYVLIYHTRASFLLLFFVIPLSGELELPGGLATDLPGEPMLWGLTVVTIILVILNGYKAALLHPVSVGIVVVLLWMIVTTLLSAHPIVSLKFVMAKVWYVLPFFVLPFYLIQRQENIDQIIDVFLLGMLLSATYYFIRHGMLDFDFEARVNAGKPIWRNHVNYACTLVCSLPMIWYRYQRTSHKRYVLLGLITFIFLYFAFARVSYLCIGAAIGFALLLRFRLVTVAAGMGFLIIIGCAIHVVRSDDYLRFAPQYEKAITQGDFGSKVENTFSGQDISTMERVHRWVAGSNMIQEKPLTGFGPSTFYSVYKPYTRYTFETYVSANPERSGIHSYYLMTLVEQGWIGLLLLISLILLVIRKIEIIYHRIKERRFKVLVMMSGMIFAMILMLNTINDMLEVIKIGSLFFFVLFLVVWVEGKSLPHSNH